MEQLRVLDLFSGIGGFALGLKRAGGFETVAYCEIDPYCQGVLRARMLDGSLDTAPICTDVRRLDGETLRGRVEVICGGFPCQDVAQGGLRAGIEGARSGLWSEFSRLICQIRPQWVIVENVSGLLVRGAGRVFGDLAEAGYDAEWASIPAAAVGAPHLRDRVWILAYPRRLAGDGDGAEARRCFVFPEGGGGKPSEWSDDRQLVALVPGVHPGVAQDWWRTQSAMGRTIDGFPERLDQLKALGNSVVPQVIEWIGRRLKEIA